jgi:OTU domain-containing protein 6
VKGPSTHDYLELRKLAAKHLREHPEEFKPFLDVDSEDDYEVYCSKVESPTLAEWGGQIEIRAIANSLEHLIHIYDAEAPVLVMGERMSGAAEAEGQPLIEPLRLTYHRHYYALGEHYNSVEKIAKS